MFERLESRVSNWLARRSAQRNLEGVVESIAAANNILQTKEGLAVPLARQHVDCADRMYKLAMEQFKDEDYEESAEFVERAKIHLQITNLHLVEFGQSKFEPGFEDDSAEQAIDQLSESIARTKLSVEYANAHVSPQVKRGLASVVRYLTDSIERLKDENPLEAIRLADAGHLLLYKLVSEIELESKQPVVALNLPARFQHKQEKRIKKVIDRILECKRLILELGVVPPHEVTDHLADSEESLTGCLEGMAAGDDSALSAFLDATSLEVKLAEKMISSLNPGGPLGSEPARKEAPIEGYERFQTTAARLLRALPELKTGFGTKLAIKHLEAARDFYAQACRALRAGQGTEADRLAHASLLDLDFARQVVYSKSKPVYRDI